MNAETDSAPSANGAGRPGKSLADLGIRALSAIVMAGLALGALWVGGWLFAAFWTAAGIAILWEWQHLVGGDAVSNRLSVGAGAIALVAGLGSLGYPEAAVSVIAIAALVTGWLTGGERVAFRRAVSDNFPVHDRRALLHAAH